jgi:hypothetical protein
LDLFEVYPQLAGHHHQALSERSLRLISISGFVYDEESFYFELGQPRHWGQLVGGEASIGVGVPKVQPDGSHPPHQALLRHIRKSWRSQVDLYPAGHSYLLDESGVIHVMGRADADLPYMFVFTVPRLGGGEVPDALVQAVYLLPARRVEATAGPDGILKVARSALQEFLSSESWLLGDIIDRPWAELPASTHYPADASLRPVLALRGLRTLMEAGTLPGLPSAPFFVST